jgi:hypothetical protein
MAQRAPASHHGENMVVLLREAIVVALFGMRSRLVRY